MGIRAVSTQRRKDAEGGFAVKQGQNVVPPFLPRPAADNIKLSSAIAAQIAPPFLSRKFALNNYKTLITCLTAKPPFASLRLCVETACILIGLGQKEPKKILLFAAPLLSRCDPG